MTGPLNGVRIIDLTAMISDPLASTSALCWRTAVIRRRRFRG